MHYFIIIVVIAAIVFWQISSFIDNKKNIFLFKNIFPENQSKFHLVQDNSTNNLLGIDSQHKNFILDVIISSINKYLINNKGAVSDFHLMKDIVDRNCDAKEEEIHTQIPVPLYLGLVGTMAGILIGVGFLVFSGGLENLISSPPIGVTDEIKKQLSENGVNGVKALMGGVALAMISSIIGILLTTFSSHLTKNAKAEVEKHKNTFLSWIQAELLPNISNNTSSALVKMTGNLSKFNETFALNSMNLGNTLSKVNDSYQNQAVLMKAINQLKIGDIATANIDVYDKLKNSTKEIGVFAKYLQKSNEYLESIQSLNQKLDNYENRTQIIENAGNFFIKNEKWLAENIDSANLEVRAALERFKGTTEESLINLQESFNGQILNFNGVMQRQQEQLQEALSITNDILSESFTKTQASFEKAIIDQQQILQGKLQETSKLIEELKNLTHIKDGIKEFKEAINRQNIKIDELAKEIRFLANVKTSGGTIKQEFIIPKWLKILIIAGSSLIGVACLSYIVPLLFKWISNLVNWLF